MGSIASQPTDTNETKASKELIVRIIAVCGLLLVEYLIISFLFDAQALLRVEGFGPILGNIGYVGPMIVVAAAATIALRGAKLRTEISAFSYRNESLSRIWPWLALHVLIYGVFLLLTHQLYKVVEVTHSPSILWAIGWGLSAFLVLLSSFPIVLPIRTLVGLIRTTSNSVLFGVLLGLLAWFAGMSTRHLWQTMGGVTLEGVFQLLMAFSQDVQVDRSELIIGIDPFFIHVAPICSGFEGIGLIAAFMGLYITVYHRQLRFPHVLVLLPIVILAVWALNIVRIAALIAIGSWISPEIALGGFHSKAGWVFFCVVALVGVALMQRSSWFSLKASSRKDESQQDVETDNPTAAHLVPLMAVIATSLLAGLFVKDFDLYYPLRVLAAGIALWYFRDYYRPFKWSWSWEAPVIGIVVFILWITIVDDGDGTKLQKGISGLPIWAASIWLLFRVIGTAITVPIVEELAFRSYLMRRIALKDFMEVPKTAINWLPILLSSLAFGLLHQQYMAGTLAGILYAFAQCRRGSTFDAIVAHATTNALIAGNVLLLGKWGFW